MPATARPAAITIARLGSHVPLGIPKKSRKASTFAGETICEITRPRPKMKPQRRLASTGMVSASNNVAHQRNDNDRCDHEHHGGDDRARRQPGDTADAVAGGAAVAQSGPEADQ